ncbi:MAG: L-lactate permease [Thermoleophilaceae bacterium]
MPVAFATVGFVLAGQVIAGSGAAALLAGGAANALGGAYAAAAPMFGALGGGLTGSNVGSNALFMPLQVEAAAGTGSSVALIAGIQNVAGSHASFLSPQRLVLAATATRPGRTGGRDRKGGGGAGGSRAPAARGGRGRRVVVGWLAPVGC